MLIRKLELENHRLPGNGPEMPIFRHQISEGRQEGDAQEDNGSQEKTGRP